MLLGGSGVISVVSNVIPGHMKQLTHACLDGEFEKAGNLQLKIRSLIESLFCEVNPIPVKTALSLMGYCDEIFRLPLCKMSDANRCKLREILLAHHLI